jgi:hypothetical protein
MILSDNPLTRETHQRWKTKIEREFGHELNYLSLIHYLESSPRKYYNREHFDLYLGFLNKEMGNNSSVLLELLNECESALSIGNTILAEINTFDIHDVILPDDSNELINFIDKDIHFNILRLYESPFYALLFVIAKYKRIIGNKGTNSLDIFNVIEDLKNTEFGFTNLLFNNTVRNGIAHGKVIYTDFDTIYKDKKGNEAKLSKRDIVALFDKLLDTTNAFSLAMKVFVFSQAQRMGNSVIKIPKSFLREELKTVCDLPGWRVINCFENLVLGDRHQLTVHVKNDYWDPNKVRWFTFSTALWAERLTPEYDRIFISMSCSKALPGFAAFNGRKLTELRKNNTEAIDPYFEALEDKLLMFVPRWNFPRLVYKLGSLLIAFKVKLPLAKENYRERLGLNRFIVRDSKFHSKGKFLLIQDSSVVVRANSLDEVKALVETNFKQIVGLVRRQTKKQISIFSIKRYLPIKYITVFIYDSDKRVRNLRFSGLIPELICTINVNSSAVKFIDLFNSEVDQRGKYRLLWHRHCGVLNK